LSLCLAREDGAASDAIAATTSGTGRTACAVPLFTTAIKATCASRLRLSVDQQPGAVLRLDAPEDTDVVAIVAPAWWSGARAEAARHSFQNISQQEAPHRPQTQAERPGAYPDERSRTT
jgi:hypothetical protein